MLPKDAQDLLELDVQEFELVESGAESSAQSLDQRTITTCAIC